MACKAALEQLHYFQRLRHDNSTEPHAMKITSAVTLFFLLASYVSAGDWAQLRGPNFNGSTDEKNLPTTWSQTENIEWSVEMPGPSAATPIAKPNSIYIPFGKSPEKSVISTLPVRHCSSKHRGSSDRRFGLLAGSFTSFAPRQYAR